MADPQLIRRGDVHLWYMRTDVAVQAGWLLQDQPLLSPNEQQRHKRFLFQKDRDQYLVAHALKRKTLSRYALVSPGDWRFHIGEFGKPEIDPVQNTGGLRFNLSHCHGLAMCGVTVGSDIGVDCEPADRDVELHQLARRVFSRSEYEYLEAVPAAQQTETFFRFWTLKEAYIKARGLGLSLPLQEFSFDISAPPAIRVKFHSGIDDQPDQWQFAQPSIAAGSMCAVAIRLPVGELMSLEVHDR